jgi:putative ABC transport system permease protein
MLADIRHACRALARAPKFTTVAGGLLALGLGLTLAVFTVVDAVLLKALPYPDAGRIVTVWEASERSRTIGVSAPNFRDWHESATTFSALAAWTGGRTTVLGGQEPTVAGVYLVTRDFFAALGVSPVVGRPFAADEAVLNGAPVVIVSHGFWTRVLGANRDLSRLSLEVDGRRAAVVGVMPLGFTYPPGADVWTPYESKADTSGRTAHNLRVVGRLKPTGSLPAAQIEMTSIARRLEAQYGADHDGTDASVVPLLDYTVRNSRTVLLVLLGAVGVVLLATCANVANLVIARGTDRARELALRLSLGAGRGDLLRLLVLENIVLGVGAAVAGMAAAVGLVRALVALAPAAIPRISEAAIDGRTAIAAAVLAIATPLVFGLWPALAMSRTAPRESLADGGRLGTRAGTGRARQALVAVEIAVALLVVTAAGLLGRSLLGLLRIDPGFSPAGVVTMETTIPTSRYPEIDAVVRMYDTWLATVDALPGVTGVGLVSAPPLSGFDPNGAFLHEGQTFDDIKANWVAQSATYRVASAGYFAAMGIQVTRGRGFDARDVAGADVVAVVNDALVRKHFAGRDPIGRRIQFAGMDRVNPWLTVVGVAGDVRFRDLGTEALPEVYVNYQQVPARAYYGVTTAIRTAAGTSVASIVPALRDRWRDLAPDVPVVMSEMTALVERSTASRRFTFAVVTMFGVSALILAALGVHGILSYTVVQRTREVGIRMALGATSSSVASLVCRDAGGAVAVGVAAGIAAVVGLTRFLQSLLFGVTALDPVTLVAATGALAAVALVAAWWPVRRAAAIDPVVAMRTE